MSRKCPKCGELKVDAEFFAWKDPTRTMQWCRECRAHYPYPVAESYARQAIRLGTKLPATAKLPGWLVEVKRLAIQVKRLAAEREAYEDHKRHC